MSKRMSGRISVHMSIHSSIAVVRLLRLLSVLALGSSKLSTDMLESGIVDLIISAIRQTEFAKMLPPATDASQVTAAADIPAANRVH